MIHPQTIICASAIAFAAKSSAFTHPIHFVAPIHNTLRQQHHPTPHHHHHHQTLHVQSKDSAFVTTSTENDTLTEDDYEMVRVARVLTRGLSDDDNQTISTTDAMDVYNEENELAVAQAQHVYTTTAEEDAIFMADAPGTPQEGAFDFEEGALNSEGLFWRGVVVILCALWASNFAMAKFVLAIPDVDASLYAVTRFSVAALSLLPGTINSVRKGNISWDTAKGAMVCGSWVAFGYLGQLIGLLDTTPSRSCVICSLNCIFVAILAETMRVNSAKKRGFTSDFDVRKLIPALIAVTGVAIIELKGAGGDPTWGDFISFAQPIGFGMGYFLLEELMRKQPSAALPVSAIKLAVAATAALVYYEISPHASAVLDAVVAIDGDVVVESAKQSTAGLGFKVPDFSPILSSPTALGAIFYTGIVTTSLALWVESIAFQRVAATDASIILTTEPLFAAATSAVLVGETFGMSDAVGAAFIIGACVYAVKMGDGNEVCDEDTKECVVVDAK